MSQQLPRLHWAAAASGGMKNPQSSARPAVSKPVRRTQVKKQIEHAFARIVATGKALEHCKHARSHGENLAGGRVSYRQQSRCEVGPAALASACGDMGGLCGFYTGFMLVKSRSGCQFVAVGSDMQMLTAATKAHMSRSKVFGAGGLLEHQCSRNPTFFRMLLLSSTSLRASSASSSLAWAISCKTRMTCTQMESGVVCSRDLSRHRGFARPNLEKGACITTSFFAASWPI